MPTRDFEQKKGFKKRQMAVIDGESTSISQFPGSMRSGIGTASVSIRPQTHKSSFNIDSFFVHALLQVPNHH